MTGVLNLRPPKPKLSFVWDVGIFFKYFEQGDNNSDNQINYWHKSFQFYCYCLVLIELVLSNYLVCLIWFLNDLLVTFIPTEVLKHSRKGKPQDKFEYRSYTDNKLCIISCLREYFTRQDKHVGLDTGQLINILKKPFKGASTDTTRRWVKDIFILNNTDFSPHSCQTASTSKVKNMEVNIDEILKWGCWKNQKNFFIYYDKFITEYAPNDIDFKRICQV